MTDTPIMRTDSPAHVARMFPTLTERQIARIATHGVRRQVDAGEVLIEAGAANVPFFVVASGQIEVTRPTAQANAVVAVHGPGAFTGEVNLIQGRRSLARIRVTQAGDVIELTRDQLLAVIQSDGEIGEIVMSAFINRRLSLIAHGVSDVVLVGSRYSAETLRIREFLTRNGQPFTYIDLDQDADVQAVLDRVHVAAEEIPVVISGGDGVLRNPTNEAIAEALGFNDAIERTHVRDVVIVGAGPSGLAAAVYGASEGLDVLVLEATAPGGQAGSSSKIENYLGFPVGVSGQELAGRALAQAQKFGAEILIASGAEALACDRTPYRVRLGDDGTCVPAKTVVIATGAQYRRPPIPELPRFEGAGVYYSATFMEAQLCVDDEVVVVGGGNSAGQAAMFLSRTAKHVHVLVRSTGLADSMSRYLIRRIEDAPEITLRTETEIVAVDGDRHLESVTWRDNRKGETTSKPIRHVFMMTGAVPNTAWLHGCVTLDASGFIKTGPDLSREDLIAAKWPLVRAPRLLETSRPGVFAVGDVRCGNVKRVASAVGEGSIAISFVHQTLAE